MKNPKINLIFITMLTLRLKLIKPATWLSFLFVIGLLLSTFTTTAQTSTEFWLAPPEVTSSHADQPIYVRVATAAEPAEITIDMPANPSFTPIEVSLAANSSHTDTLTLFKGTLETKPKGQVLNTGLRITSTAEITAIYEVSPTNNPDIIGLKGLNGLGTEFYTPFQNKWVNGYGDAYTSFDIVATEDNTTVLVYPTSTLDGGQPAFQSFTITLNKGQTYSASISKPSQPQFNPAGSQIISDKPIAVTVKDDSITPSGYGCKDLNVDQIVPVDIVGNEYIVHKGRLYLDTPELAVIVATQSNTQISVNGSYHATLFNGETKIIDITDPLTYITGTKNFYLIHVSGFGCETGTAILPPLNCAGSEQVSFVRSTSEPFFLNLLVPAGAEDGFILNGDADVIDPNDFEPVPGTGGSWVGTQIQYVLSDTINWGVANLITNTKEVFSLGLINGGPGSGTRFGYFSEFSAEIIVDAGPNQTVCANKPTELSGSVTGGATNGVWSTNGTGTFEPDEFDLDAVYVPSSADLSAGAVTLKLTSVSNCFPVEDEVKITYTPAPIVDAGDAISACENNTTVVLDGYVDPTISTGGLWSGGAGTFSPHAGLINASYTPTQAEVDDGSVKLYLESTGNGNCFAERDSVLITFSDPPTVDAGEDQYLCENNATAQLIGNVTIAGGGEWSGGSGSFTPSIYSLTPNYIPGVADLLNKSVTLTLTSNDNKGCNPVSHQVTLHFNEAPAVNAGNDISVCKNNPDVQLNGNITLSGGGEWTGSAKWSGGNGSFYPDEFTLDAVYTPTLSEILNGGVTLQLESIDDRDPRDGGECSSETNTVNITFTNAPEVSPGTGGEVCKNNAAIELDGNLNLANFGMWSGGNGTFAPNPTNLNAVYHPTPDEIEDGSVTLILTTLDHGNCLPVSEEVTYTFTTAPTANAGLDRDVCSNNPSIQLSGGFTLATGSVWGGGAGGFSPNPNTLNAVYTPTESEINDGSVTLTLTTIHEDDYCNPVTDQVKFTFTDTPTAIAGNNITVCANNPQVDLEGAVTLASGGIWGGGLGSFDPDPESLITKYNPTATEINSGSLTLTLTTTGNGDCNAVSNDVTITFTAAPEVNAGDPISVCENKAQVSLSGAVDVATGGTWSGGDGDFAPGPNSLTTFYNPTQAEIDHGSLVLTLTSTGNGKCNPVQDVVPITFTPGPTVSAGNDVTVCFNNPVVDLNGSINRATGGVWSGGSGSFSDITSLGASYTPSNAELAAGTATLYLTTTGNGDCNSETAQMTITITPAPIVNAGTGGSLCANNAEISLNGTVTGADGGKWSGGSGTYVDGATKLITTYIPSQSEIDNGSVTLTLTSTGNDKCLEVEDQVTFTFTPAPVVDAGVNQTLCANNAEIQLAGSVTVSSGGTWSGGDGVFSNPNALNAKYTPSQDEIDHGSVTLRLTSTGNGTCSSEYDEITLTFTPAPTAFAGVDKEVCADDPEVTINGLVSVATGGAWGGGTGTYNPDPNSLNITYIPSQNEINNGEANLHFTTTGNGNCNAVTDYMKIIINPIPVVNAGADLSICSNNPSFDLNGIVQHAGGGKWTGGLGDYDTDNTDLKANYTPTYPEIVSGSMVLTLTSTNNGKCAAVEDELHITFTPTPTVSAGEDVVLCETSPLVYLDGDFTVAGGVQWSGGNGNYNPNSLTKNAVYTPTADELINGGVTLTLTSTNNGNCLPVSDEVNIVYNKKPSVSVGSTLVSCANNPIVELNGAYANADGAKWTGGTGYFDANNEDPEAHYTPSNSEISNGGVYLTLTTYGSGACADVSKDVYIQINPTPIVDAGTDETLCANNSLVQLGGTVQHAGGGVWSGGAGNFAPNKNSLSAKYTPTSSELDAGFVSLTLTSTGNGTCNEVTDKVIITFTPAPKIDAGLDQTACENNAAVTLNGSFTISEGAQWSGGSGTFISSNTDMNAEYIPSPSELIAGEVTLTLASFGNGNCLPVTDQMKINYTPAPVVDAGMEDYFVCVDNLVVPLSASISGPTTTGIWSTSGSGVFVENTSDLTGSYQISSADSLIGEVTLTLTSTSNGLCNPVTDEIKVHISPAGTASAGPDQTVCKNNANVVVDGTIGGAATSGTWLSSGTGTFTPNPNQPSATYIPSQDDLNAGNVTLTFAVNSCNQASDDMVITFTPEPKVNAGANITICSSEPNVQILGSITGASTTGEWTTLGTGNFLSDVTSMNNIYEFSAQDIDNQEVKIVLHATDIGDCMSVSDTLTISIFPQGTANAGPNMVMCKNNSEAQLQGSLTVADQGLWTTTGTGTFSPNAEALDAIYIPSEGDLVNGTVNLVLNAVNSCNAASDNMNISFTAAPVMDAGPDQSACGDILPFQISGDFENTGGAVWSTSGSGTFQNANSLNTFYVASQYDIDNGGVHLILTSTDYGNCLAVSDSMYIAISTGIEVDAGTDRSTCVDAGTVQLYGSITNGTTTGTWSTSGNGTFLPNANDIHAKYQFTQNDIDNGGVELTLTSTNNGICNETSDSFTLTFGSIAHVFAGNPIEECITTDLVQLHGVVSSETNTGVWSTSGDGTFYPNVTNLNAYYEPGTNDIANGSVELTLTSTFSNLCTESSDNLMVTFKPLPTVNAGDDKIICGDIVDVQLLGSVSGASGGVWSTSGSGTFFPNDSVLTALYTPSAIDSMMGNVTLTLKTIGNGVCVGSTDHMNISFSGASEADAGFDQNVCEDIESILLNGTIEGNGTYSWSTSGTGNFNPSNSALTTSYEPSQADKDNGYVTLYLKADGTGNCPSHTDSLKVTFNTLPVISAQAVVESCVTSDEVSLQSSVSGAASVLWVSPAGGSFSPDPNNQNTTYHPTAGELLNGSTTLTLKAFSGNSCGEVTKNIQINFRSLAEVNAGADKTVCETQPTVSLGGMVSGSGYDGKWSTNSFGSFSPDPNQLDAEYVIGENDILIGLAKLILTSTNNGACPPVTDTLNIVINKQPVVNAGNDQYICSSTSVVELSGTSEHAESIAWSTTGDGVFLPSDSELINEYIVGNNDVNSESVNLILTAQALLGCTSQSDTLTIHISSPLKASFDYGVACVNSEIQFVDETEVFAGDIAGWRWDFGDGNVSNQKNPTFVFDTPGSRSVELAVTSTLGCSDTIVQFVNVNDVPNAGFVIKSNSLVINEEVKFTDTSIGAENWDWSFGDGSPSVSSQNPVHTFFSEGNYEITLTVVSAAGCSNTVKEIIYIDGFRILPPKLPNTFSPNDDGLNDVYYVRGGPFIELDMRIYDGWGREIFRTTDQSIGWDGTEKGKQSPTGAYVYTIKATNLSGDQFDYSGKVNLIR